MKFISVCLIATMFATVYTMPAMEARGLEGLDLVTSNGITAPLLDPDSDQGENSALSGVLGGSD
jgi:hypothetical protein